MLLVCGLFLAQNAGAKTYTKQYVFNYLEYEDDGYYAYCEDGSRWKVTYDGESPTYEEYYGIFMRGGSRLTFTSEKIYPGTATLKINAGAGDQSGSDLIISSDGQSVSMYGINTSYYDSPSSITTHNYTLDLNRNQANNIQVSLGGSNFGYTYFLVYSITVTYESDYGISITTLEGNQISVTDDNKDNVLGENIPTVMFDGIDQLTLDNANIGKITIEEVNGLDSEFNLQLKGENKIQNNTKAIVNNGGPIRMYMYTNARPSGSLQYICTAGNLTKANDAFQGFTLYITNPLAAVLTKEDTRDIVDVRVVLTPIVSKDHMEVTLNGASGQGIGEDIQDKTTEQLAAGCEVNNILYTLPHEKDGYIDDESVVAADGKIIAINSSMVRNKAIDAANYLGWKDIAPGSEEYAKRFHGLTFKIPAGTGVIKIVARTNETGVLNVLFSDFSQEPITFNDAKTEFKEYEIPYACTDDRYVLIFNTTKPVSGSRRAPGRKETTTTEIRGIKINANTIDDVPLRLENKKTLTKEMVNAALQDGHIIIDDPEINDMNVLVFEDLQDKEVTYIDLSKTSLRQSVVRTYNMWKGIPAKTLICVPAGCTAALNSPNVVVGSVCHELVLSETDKAFDTPKYFLAKVLKTERDYSAYGENGCTVFLPFGLNEQTAEKVGSFYEFKTVRNNQAEIVAVTSTEANKPYILKGATGKLQLEMVGVNPVATPSSSATSRRAAGDVSLVGTYNTVSLNSTADEQYYVYATSGDDAGKFVHVTEATSLTPYQAYLKAESATFVDKLPVVVAPSYIQGDANGDGLVNVTDIVATVNYIMEKNPANFNKAAADLTGDGEINVTDIVKMVSIIMKDGN